MNIYTKNGDEGMTDLLTGDRTSKDDPTIILLGHIDETTSHLGLARVTLNTENEDEIKSIQNKLIQIMGVISSGFTKAIDLKDDVIYLENKIDAFQKLFPELKGFVIPGEDETSARLDIARTLVRRSERQLIHIAKESASKNEIQRYLNRLSDYLFAMARMIEFREKIKQVVLDIPNLSYKTSGQTIQNITSKIARTLVDKVIEKAEEEQLKVVVSIVNADGTPFITCRMDEAFVVSFALAKKKAYTAAALRMPTHELAKLTAKGADFEGLGKMLDEEIVTLGGGYPITINDSIIGAIGVSGGSAKSDTALAMYGAYLIEDIINGLNS